MMTTVRDVMTTQVLSVTSGTPLKEVARLLVDRRVSGMPVVDDDGHVVGVVSETDFLMKEQGADAVPHRSLAHIRGESRETRAQIDKLDARTAAEVMTAPAITIAPERRISDAAAIMVARGVNRLPVLEDGRLVGMVTRADLVRAYLRSDDELRQTIRDDVVVRVVGLDPDAFRIRVVDGIVSISGSVDRRLIAETLESLVRMVPGVVAVQSDLTWSVDDRSLTWGQRL